MSEIHDTMTPELACTPLFMWKHGWNVGRKEETLFRLRGEKKLEPILSASDRLSPRSTWEDEDTRPEPRRDA